MTSNLNSRRSQKAGHTGTPSPNSVRSGCVPSRASALTYPCPATQRHGKAPRGELTPSCWQAQWWADAFPSQVRWAPFCAAADRHRTDLWLLPNKGSRAFLVVEKLCGAVDGRARYTGGLRGVHRMDKDVLVGPQPGGGQGGPY